MGWVLACLPACLCPLQAASRGGGPGGGAMDVGDLVIQPHYRSTPWAAEAAAAANHPAQRKKVGPGLGFVSGGGGGGHPEGAANHCC